MGDLRVSITLAPTEPARVQFLEVVPIPRNETLAPTPGLSLTIFRYNFNNEY
jgi:hypothetical protein